MMPARVYRDEGTPSKTPMVLQRVCTSSIQASSKGQGNSQLSFKNEPLPFSSQSKAVVI